MGHKDLGERSTLVVRSEVLDETYDLEALYHFAEHHMDPKKTNKSIKEAFE